MLKQRIPVVLLGLCLIAGAIGLLTVTMTGCLDTAQKEQIKKDVLSIAALAIEYKNCTDDAVKADLKTDLQDKAKELARRYGQAAAVLVIKRLEAKGRLKPEVASFLLTKLNADTGEEKEAEAAEAVKD